MIKNNFANTIGI